ncbi:uncharacterized protein LOC142225876 isoform X1 [Haematobia irritans]|uniref:uncharacterized protein LOC142225876 isoform X1 n=1 Tax=Haematobia irritans TaxID=7368 RepID=UPI003F4FFDCB
MLKLYTFLQKNKQIKGREEQKLLETIQTNDIQNDPDLFSLKVLWTLHCYLHPTGRFERKISGGKKEVYRYTSKDSQMSFFYIGNSLQALQEHISSLSTKTEEILPFILGVGELNNITEYFVYTDGTLLAFSSFLRSVDVCFKLFHLFHQQYPKPSETVWSFIEHYFFEINENPINSKVSILINDLQRQTKSD